MSFFRGFIERLRSRERELNAEVYADLVESLYGPIAALIAGVINGVLCAFVVATWTGNMNLALCGICLALAGAFRVAVSVAYHRRVTGDSIEETRMWEWRFAYGALPFAAFLGTLGYVAIQQVDDPVIHLLCAAVTVGWTASVSSRNAGRPALVGSQIALSISPIVVALMLQGGLLYQGLAFMLLLNFFSVVGISREIHQMLFTALFATHDNIVLAAKLDMALNNMAHGLCMFDHEGRLQLFNHRLLEIFDLSLDTIVIGSTSDDLIGLAGSRGGIDSLDVPRVSDQLRLLNANLTDHLVFRTTSGRTVYLRRDPVEDGGYLILVEDITEREAAAARIVHMAHFDTLTNLPNRASFHAECERVLGSIKQNGGQAAVLSIDLDHFKKVNDTLGHPVGDRLLAAVAEKLRQVVRDEDVVARFGGDEFVILQHPVPNRASAMDMATRVIEALTDSYRIDGQQVIVGASVGIAMAVDDGDTVDTLIKNSDLALYHVKSTNRGTADFFRHSMDVEAQKRRLLELEMRTALEANAFELHFQPIVSLTDGRIAACEALIRWNHPDHGQVPPQQFIPVAEDSGMVVDIGAWVLHEACRQAASWPEHIRVAVNLSPVQFRFRGLVDTVKSALQKSGLHPSRLELEITESVLIQDSDGALVVLDEFVEMGVKLSLDDFGTGYSSLSYLQRFPFDKIKIDRSFVQGVTEDEQALAIVRGIFVMAKPAGIEIVAEGIETDEQRATLAAEGCPLGQGFHFSKPQAAGDIFHVLHGTAMAA